MQQTNTLLSNIRRIIKLYDNMLKPVCDRYGLVPIEATIISFLQNNPGRDTAADIVELRMLAKSNVSQAVESLIQKSLMQRQQDIEAVREAFRKQIFRGFTKEEQQQFSRFNDRIAENTRIAMEGDGIE